MQLMMLEQNKLNYFRNDMKEEVWLLPSPSIKKTTYKRKDRHYNTLTASLVFHHHFIWQYLV